MRRQSAAVRHLPDHGHWNAPSNAIALKIACRWEMNSVSRNDACIPAARTTSAVRTAVSRWVSATLRSMPTVKRSRAGRARDRRCAAWGSRRHRRCGHRGSTLPEGGAVLQVQPHVGRQGGALRQVHRVACRRWRTRESTSGRRGTPRTAGRHGGAVRARPQRDRMPRTHGRRSDPRRVLPRHWPMRLAPFRASTHAPIPSQLGLQRTADDVHVRRRSDRRRQGQGQGQGQLRRLARPAPLFHSGAPRLTPVRTISRARASRNLGLGITAKGPRRQSTATSAASVRIELWAAAARPKQPTDPTKTKPVSTKSQKGASKRTAFIG